tara:strand:- start:932 stop:1168 length:237 start_codon:yes stop_codon:yes gene_type:complete
MKIKKKLSRKARLNRASEKVRNHFYGKLIPSGDRGLVDRFNSEWETLAYDFGLKKLYTLSEYEVKVKELIEKYPLKEH